MRLLPTLLLLSCLLAACAAPVPPEHAAITAGAQRYLKTNAAPNLGPMVIQVQEVSASHARVWVSPVKPTTDPAIMYLRKNALGTWEGISVGTGFSPDDFNDLDIPQDIRQ